MNAMQTTAAHRDITELKFALKMMRDISQTARSISCQSRTVRVFQAAAAASSRCAASIRQSVRGKSAAATALAAVDACRCHFVHPN